jgi:hypothetical protein
MIKTYSESRQTNVSKMKSLCLSENLELLAKSQTGQSITENQNSIAAY